MLLAVHPSLKNAVKIGLLVAAVLIGVLALVSGTWLATIDHPGAVAGILGGVINLVVGCWGLFRLKHIRR